MNPSTRKFRSYSSNAMKPLTTSRKFSSESIWVPSFFSTGLIWRFLGFPSWGRGHIACAVVYYLCQDSRWWHIYPSLANAVRFSPSIPSELPNSSKFFGCTRQIWRTPGQLWHFFATLSWYHLLLETMQNLPVAIKFCSRDIVQSIYLVHAVHLHSAQFSSHKAPVPHSTSSPFTDSFSTYLRCPLGYSHWHHPTGSLQFSTRSPLTSSESSTDYHQVSFDNSHSQFVVPSHVFHLLSTGSFQVSKSSMAFPSISYEGTPL